MCASHPFKMAVVVWFAPLLVILVNSSLAKTMADGNAVVRVVEPLLSPVDAL
jgi:hypothetical protein